jgi:hypothetical protein
MDKASLVLAALKPGGGFRYSPVQVQKLLFLIDRQIPDLVDGPHFDFQPYHYGPFDRTVYQVLTGLAVRGFVDVDTAAPRRTYSLTPEGLREAERLFAALPLRAQDFITRTSEFVRRLSFAQLVSAIYKAYPEIKANSVFQH